MIPIDLDLIDLDENNCLVAVSFNHINTLWVLNAFYSLMI